MSSVSERLVSVGYSLKWTHKKGKVKPQQFWIYCENGQFNYLYVQLEVGGMEWSPVSFIGRSVDPSDPHFYLVSSSGGRDGNARFNGRRPTDMTLYSVVRIHPDSPSMGVVDHIDVSLLRRIHPREFKLSIYPEMDQTLPIHPNQGSLKSVIINEEMLEGNETYTPFHYSFRLLFRNRIDGWFKYNAALSYQGIELIRGQSEIFMFNNPRLTRKKALSSYSAVEVKFMQCYQASPCSTWDWNEVATNIGFTKKRAAELMHLAPNLFNVRGTSATYHVMRPFKVKKTALKNSNQHEEVGRKRRRAYDSSSDTPFEEKRQRRDAYCSPQPEDSPLSDQSVSPSGSPSVSSSSEYAMFPEERHCVNDSVDRVIDKFFNDEFDSNIPQLLESYLSQPAYPQEYHAPVPQLAPPSTSTSSATPSLGMHNLQCFILHECSPFPTFLPIQVDSNISVDTLKAYLRQVSGMNGSIYMLSVGGFILEISDQFTLFTTLLENCPRIVYSVYQPPHDVFHSLQGIVEMLPVPSTLHQPSLVSQSA